MFSKERGGVIIEGEKRLILKKNVLGSLSPSLSLYGRILIFTVYNISILPYDYGVSAISLFCKRLHLSFIVLNIKLMLLFTLTHNVVKNQDSTVLRLDTHSSVRVRLVISNHDDVYARPPLPPFVFWRDARSESGLEAQGLKAQA